MGKCHGSASWLQKDDKTGRKVSEWAAITKKDGKEEFFCRVCSGPVNVSSKGFQALTQHASYKSHQQNARIKLEGRQLHLTAVPPTPPPPPPPAPADSRATADTAVTVANTAGSHASGSSGSTGQKTIALYSVRDQATKAELLWSLKCIASDFSSSSCENIGEDFRAMFPDSKTAADFKLGRTKAAYLVTDALAPYLQLRQRDEMAGEYYTLLFDETTNNAKEKELQTAVRYWSRSKGEVVTEHLQTFFIGRATAKDLKKKLDEAVTCNCLSLLKLLMIGSDGPNVNKTVLKMVQEDMANLQRKALLDIGSCNIHILHNAYLKGLEAFGEDASDLIIDVYDYLDGWPSRIEDFEEIQSKFHLPHVSFIKHVKSRWLTLEGAAERLLQQWDAVEYYFKDFLPKKKPKLTEKKGYNKIKRLLAVPTMKAEVMFVKASAKIFTKATKFLQKEEPLIHCLHANLKEIADVLVRRSCKEAKEPQDVFEKENLLSAENVVVGDDIRNLILETKEGQKKSKDLVKANISEKDKLVFLRNCQKHYVAACKHIIQKSVLSKDLVKSFRCLDPANRFKEESCRDIVEIARAMPFHVPMDVIQDEWKALQCVPDSFEKTPITMRIDHYWKPILEERNNQGDLKYPNVARVVKASLSLSHGQADVERGFSTSGKFLTPDRASMNERTLNAALVVKSELRKYDNKPHLIPINRKLMDMARVASQSYETYLAQKKRKAEEEAKKREAAEAERKLEEGRKLKLQECKRKLEEEEVILKRIKTSEKECSENANKLFVEANERLKKALAKNDLREVALAQAMLEGVASIRKQAEEKRSEASIVQKVVDKKKASLLKSLEK